MDIVEYIKDLDDKEIEEFYNERTEFLEDNVNDKYDYTIGYNLDYNPSAFNLLDFEENIPKVQLTAGFNGYIPLGTKVVYGMVYNENAKVTSNWGYYYYIDDNSYILDFIKDIKNKNINDIYDLFDYIYEFIHDYFGDIEIISREDMMRLVVKNDTAFYKPVEEHKYSMFKGKGNGQCSEMAVMAQNILSFLGINSKLIIGSHKMDKDEIEGHAYNLVEYDENEENKSILIDFAASVFIIDFNYKVIGYAPFMHYLDTDINDTYIKLINGECVTANDYTYMIDKKSIWVMEKNYQREYSIATRMEKVKKLK